MEVRDELRPEADLRFPPVPRTLTGVIIVPDRDQETCIFLLRAGQFVLGLKWSDKKGKTDD